MRRRFAWLVSLVGTLALLPVAHAGEQGISFSTLPGPTAMAAGSPSFTTAPDGAAWLSWVEPAQQRGHANTLRVARFDRATQRWQAPGVVSTSATVIPNPYDVPQIAFSGDGTAYALWIDAQGDGWLSVSQDPAHGWSAPTRWSAPNTEAEKASLVRLADGRVLAAWLGGVRGGTAGRQQLHARAIGDTADHVIDASVCDCCPTALAAFLDGGALVAYRGRTDENIRDVQTARFNGQTWQAPRRLSADDWHVSACPMNGPRLATDGSRVAAVWFTAAGGEPRVLASYSPDAGARWLMPLQLDRGHPAGHGDVVLLRDGALIAVWLESDGAVWLRRVNPDFTADAPVQVAPPGAALVRGSPRLALVEDYTGGHSAAQLLLAYATSASPARLMTVQVAVPEGDLLTAEQHCDCAPTPEQLVGFAIRGTVVGADATMNTVNVRHAAVPGVFAAGEHAFRVDPLVLASLQPGHAFLGRISHDAQGWKLGEIRYLAETAAPER